MWIQITLLKFKQWVLDPELATHLVEQLGGLGEFRVPEERSEELEQVHQQLRVHAPALLNTRTAYNTHSKHSAKALTQQTQCQGTHTANTVPRHSHNCSFINRYEIFKHSAGIGWVLYSG